MWKVADMTLMGRPLLKSVMGPVVTRFMQRFLQECPVRPRNAAITKTKSYSTSSRLSLHVPVTSGIANT
jgi:hypothetical protein